MRRGLASATAASIAQYMQAPSGGAYCERRPTAASLSAELKPERMHKLFAQSGSYSLELASDSAFGNSLLGPKAEGAPGSRARFRNGDTRFGGGDDGRQRGDPRRDAERNARSGCAEE